MYRVVIADDEPKVAQLIEKLIRWRELGLELAGIAHDGVAALSLIESARPDIVVTDIRMPGYDGIELIERAKRLNRDIDFIIVSGYRHFDYAQKAIRFGVEDYLLKPLKAEEINHTLRKITAAYAERDRARQGQEAFSRLAGEARRQAERDWLARLAAEEATPEEAHAFAVDFGPGPARAFALKADVRFASLNAEVRRLLGEKCTRLVGEALAPVCRTLIVDATAGDGLLQGVAGVDRADSPALKKALATVIERLQAQGELFDHIKVTAGLGPAAHDTAGLRASLRAARRALANRLVQGCGRVIERAEGEDASEVAAEIVGPSLRARLLRGVDILDVNEVRAALEAAERQTLAHARKSGMAVLAVCNECLETLSFGLKREWPGEGETARRRERMSAQLAQCSSLNEAFAALREFSADLIAEVLAQKNSEHRKPVREAQKYLLENFARPLCLEEVSRRAGFNPTYFSWLFKKETGANFLEYLTGIRVEAAKRLLGEAALSVADIAEAVGYADVKHFSKVFARLTGLSPSQYRKLNY